MRIRGQERIQGAQRLICRPRTEDERVCDGGVPNGASPGKGRVVELVLGGVRPVLVAGAPVGDSESEHEPDEGEAGVVFFPLEQRHQRPPELLHLVDRRVGLDHRTEVDVADPGEQLSGFVARCPGVVGRGGGDRDRLRASRSEIALARSSSSMTSSRSDGSARAPARGASQRLARRPSGPRCGPRPRAAHRRARRGPDPAGRARACSGRPAPGGSRGSRRAPRARRGAPASAAKRSCSSARTAFGSAS